MLTTLRALLLYHMQAASSSLTSLCRKPLATIMTALVIAISLVLPALFWVMTDNINQLLISWRPGGHISLYLKSPVSPVAEHDFLLRVQQMTGVKTATLISAADGFLALQQQDGMQDIMRFLPENPLPSVIEIVPTMAMSTPEKLGRLYSQLKANSIVDEARFDLEWVNRFGAMIHFITTLAYGLMILLGLAVILVIGNTLRLAIHNRHEEIQVLKLIGAKDSFILRPFLYTGMWYGLAGAIFAVLFANIVILSLTTVVNQIATAYQMHYALVGLTLDKTALLMISAITLGWLGAHFSVRSKLATIQPI